MPLIAAQEKVSLHSERISLASPSDESGAKRQEDIPWLQIPEAPETSGWSGALPTETLCKVVPALALQAAPFRGSQSVRC